MGKEIAQIGYMVSRTGSSIEASICGECGSQCAGTGAGGQGSRGRSHCCHIESQELDLAQE